MGSTISAIAFTAKCCVQYILLEADDHEEWRYPRMSLQQVRHDVALDLETILEIADVRINKMRDQVTRICEHVTEISLRLEGILYRMWRVIYHMAMMVDEVGAEAVEMFRHVPMVLLEMLERAREWRPA